MREQIRKDLLATYVKHGISDEDDLDFCVQEFFGIDVPKKNYCPGHTSPFAFLADVYFQRIVFALAFGSRGSGKTLLLEVHNALKMLFMQTPVESLVAAAARDQADRGYNYFVNFFLKEPLLAQYLAGDPQKSLTRLTNGSSLQIVYGTKKGLNGPHTQLVNLDEVELIDYPVLEQGLAISMSKGSVIAQDILSSTRKTSNGTMTRLLEEAVEINLAVRSFCIWETVEKCTRLCKNDPVHGNCPIYDKCKGKAHDGTGWYKIDDLIAKARNLSRAMFSTEFENNSPSGEVKVYGECYDESIHVLSMLGNTRFRSFRDIFGQKEAPLNWRRVGAMDFGAHFAFGQYAIEPRYGIWIKEFEYYFHGDRLLSRHAKEIFDLQSRTWRVSVNHLKKRRMIIFSDPSAKQEILEMQKLGLNCIPAMNDLASGVDAVKERLGISPTNGLPKYFIMDSCIMTRKEYVTWSHPTMPDGKPDLDAYEDGNDHNLDCDRYGIFTYPRRPKSSIKAVTVEGV